MEEENKQEESEQEERKLTKHELKEFKRQQKKEERLKETGEKKKSKFTKNAMVFVGLPVLVIIVAYAMLSFGGSNTGNATAPSGASPSKFVPSNPIHWHPHLRIILNGQEQTIPANVGIVGNVHEPIHTHDADNILHYEVNSPTEENMKLGYFFRIWRKTFNKDCIFEYCNDGTHTVKMTVNGKPNTEYENYYPKDKDEIVIEYS